MSLKESSGQGECLSNLHKASWSLPFVSGCCSVTSLSQESVTQLHMLTHRGMVPYSAFCWAGQHESSTVCDLPWGACYLRSHYLACWLHLQDFSTSSTPTALDFHVDDTLFGLVNAVVLTCSWAPMILKASALCYHHSTLLTINLLPMDLWGPFLLQQGKKCLSLMCFTLCWGAR